MSSDIIINENSSLNELYSAFHTRSSSTDSSYSSNKNDLEAETSTSNPRKDSTIKLPYPVLSDHRDPSSVLPLLQKETQTTSKKISDVIQQIESCEKRLTSNLVSEKIKLSLKSERIKRKQQLDALKKHERRVNLQIDYITTKTEIKALEDEQQQATNSDENKQFEILLKKLKQKLDQMKIYMKTRNDQMKKLSHEKQQSSTCKIKSRIKYFHYFIFFIANHHRKQLSSSQKPQQQLSSADLVTSVLTSFPIDVMLTKCIFILEPKTSFIIYKYFSFK
jgi:small-conductance mechanosensitive channel